MSPILLSQTGISKIFENPPVGSSPGADGISSKLPEITINFISVIFSELFQQSPNTSAVQLDWRHAPVKPIFRLGV